MLGKEENPLSQPESTDSFRMIARKDTILEMCGLICPFWVKQGLDRDSQV